MDHSVFYLKFLFFTILTSAILISCGGGGGGGGSSAGFVYSGNSNQAVITTTNAATFSTKLTEDSTTAEELTSSRNSERVSFRETNSLHRSRHLTEKTVGNLIRSITFRKTNPLSAEKTQVDETVQCNSGSIHTSGSINDDGTGSLTFENDNCLLGNETSNGKFVLRVDAFDPISNTITDATFIFSVLTTITPTVNESITGTLRFQVNTDSNTDRFTFNEVTRDNLADTMTKSENLTIVNVYPDSLRNSYTQTIHGRIFVSSHGYVDITTPEPFANDSISQVYPDSGQILITGANNTSAKVIALSDTAVKLELNLDGDSTFEISATLPWVELAGDAGSDVADDDGDQMNNSWELAHGLDPDNSDDADMDADNDGVSNLSEYLGGSNPGDANSTPPTADISIKEITSTPQQPVIAVSDNLTYIVSVENIGPDTAKNVVIEDVLPDGMTLISVTAINQGNCTQSTTIICELGMMRRGLVNTIEIVVSITTTTPLTAEKSVTVSSSVYDPDLANNNLTLSKLIGAQPASVIQSQIDAASPGDTIQINPGTYIGGFDFEGKDITLQSSGGASSTIIHGNHSQAIQIGPGGTIQGFTLTGARATLGAAIRVLGIGTLIRDNIFVGNDQDFGGLGVAIYGSTASPTIERNIFRDNDCGSQFVGAGVVEFANSSSPIIINNIFEDNPCHSISMSLPSGNAPNIINNSIVGNRGGIFLTRQVNSNAQIYRNNIIANNETGLQVTLGTESNNPTWENNLVFGNTSSNYDVINDLTGTNGNISSDPIFVNLTIGDYKLQIGSPAIDSGNTLNAPLVDFDGTSRPLDGDGIGGAQIDIGAFEAPSL